MDCVILAGGLGTRLRQVVSDRPKPLAEIDGRPFLDILLAQLAPLDTLSKVILAIGYKSEQVIDYYRKNPPSLDLDFSIESEPLFTGGALRLAAEKSASEHLLVMNGDSFLDVDLPAFSSFHRENRADLSLCTVSVEEGERYGAVDFDPETKQVSSFREKGAKKGRVWINGGIYLLQRKLLLDIPLNHPFSLEKEFFPGVLDKKVLIYSCEGFFIDIGTPESYGVARELFRKKI